MLKITLKNLAANKARMSLTALAVVLGVGFVVASFITADGLRDSFGNLSKEIASGPELVVRESDEFGAGGQPNEAVVEAVAAVAGVEAVEGSIDGFVQPVRADGTPLSTEGPPLVGMALHGNEELSNIVVVEGFEPGPGQFVMDVDSAADNEFEIGESYQLLTEEGSFDYTLSGLIFFGEENNTLGAVFMGFQPEDLRTLIGLEPGAFEKILVSTAETVTADDVAPGIEAALSSAQIDGLEVVNQQTIEDENAAEFNEVIGIIENVFLGFAAVSLFVSIFIIYNTFGVVLAQRVREIGLLRAVGAEAGQIRRGIIIESLMIGVLASAIGIGAGVGLHLGLLELFSLIGVDLPSTSLVIAPRTIVAGLAIGIITTMVSSIGPALRAGRVSVVEALSGSTGGDKAMTARRVVFGLVMVTAGVAVGAVGFQGVGGTAGTIAALGAGAVLVFLGVTLLSPLAAGPVVRALAVPTGPIARTPGRLASKNAVRNPRRTATTSGALMVGLSLIAAALVVSESLKTQVASVIEDSIQSDYLISDPQFNNFTEQVATDVETLPEIGTTLAVGGAPAEMLLESPPVLDGDSEGATDSSSLGELVNYYNVGDFGALNELLDLGIDEGSIDPGDLESVSRAMMLPTERAAERGLAVGDSVDMTFADGRTASFELVATFTGSSVLSGQEGVE